jgi:quinohemoprotein amine dehydrogenase
MKRIALGALQLALASGVVLAQGGGNRGNRGAAAPAATTVVEDGIPVTEPLVVSKCGSCHTKDDKGNLSRISWIRTTPEGWEEAIKRMIRLNGLTLQPTDAKAILKYLSTNHGLAPEEAKPVMYMAEHRIQDEVIPNDSIKSTCNNCHALGRAFQWHRTHADWAMLADMHSALYQQADAAFRRNGQGGGGGEGGPGAAAAPANVSLDISLDYLGKSYGLHTPEWSAWRARMRSPKVTGKWLVSAHVQGKGKYYGELTIEQGPAEDEFKTTVKLLPVNGGAAIARTGTALVYAGYAWRGRSKGTTALASNAAPDDLGSEMREAMWISPDQTWGEGRWFWGEYQEFGVDVKLKRVTAEPTLLTVDRYSLKTGSTGEKVRLLGINFPAQITPKDLDLGRGVAVKSIVSHTPTEIVATVDVAASAVPGKRDFVFGNSVLEGAVAIYDKVDYIKVLPETALARLGGGKQDPHPRGYQQLEAIGYQRGEDGKMHTTDDIELGPLDVTWSVEEFYAVFGDDDKEFVGTLNGTGLFTPSMDGPNPQRKFSRNNYGDIWAVATAKNEKDKDGKPLVGRSYLVVTVPTYIRWDQPEVTK